MKPATTQRHSLARECVTLLFDLGKEMVKQEQQRKQEEERQRLESAEYLRKIGVQEWMSPELAARVILVNSVRNAFKEMNEKDSALDPTPSPSPVKKKARGGSDKGRRMKKTTDIQYLYDKLIAAGHSEGDAIGKVTAQLSPHGTVGIKNFRRSVERAVKLPRNHEGRAKVD